mmetsp:Transcript_19969/g.50271  ORF Transcript_19969/g.50271 Transcript_19969/m.50271 type:complete len:247 (-) Transcript_19969:137-877(-)
MAAEPCRRLFSFSHKLNECAIVFVGARLDEPRIHLVEVQSIRGHLGAAASVQPSLTMLSRKPFDTLQLLQSDASVLREPDPTPQLEGLGQRTDVVVEGDLVEAELLHHRHGPLPARPGTGEVAHGLHLQHRHSQSLLMRRDFLRWSRLQSEQPLLQVALCLLRLLESRKCLSGLRPALLELPLEPGDAVVAIREHLCFPILVLAASLPRDPLHLGEPLLQTVEALRHQAVSEADQRAPRPRAAGAR